MEHKCIQENFLGRVREFMEGEKANKVLFAGIILTIVVQVGAFLYLWGSLVTTVKVHDKSIDTLVSKFDNVKFIGYVEAAEIKK